MARMPMVAARFAAALAGVVAVGCHATPVVQPPEAVGFDARHAAAPVAVRPAVALFEPWQEAAGATPGAAPVTPWMAGASFFYGSDFAESVGLVFEGTFDYAVARQFVLTGRLSYYQYRYDDGDALAPGNYHEEETGSGFGLGAEWRWYPSRRAFEWFYLGVGLGVYPITDWENKEDVNGDGVFQPNEIDDGGGAVVEVHGTLGVSIPIKGVASITPALIFGDYVGDGPGVFVGIGVRIAFGPAPPGHPLAGP